jgi:hypothetical protein
VKGRAWLVYTGLRLLAFVGCYLLLVLVGLRGLLAVAAALLLSSLASLFLLGRQRDAVAASLEARRGERTAEQARLRGMLDDPHQER